MWAFSNLAGSREVGLSFPPIPRIPLSLPRRRALELPLLIVSIIVMQTLSVPFKSAVSSLSSSPGRYHGNAAREQFRSDG